MANKHCSDYTNRYLKKTGRMALVLQMVPFVGCLILNGSLASGAAKESSDIDLLIIAKDGRIFTVRFLVNLIAVLLGQKRSSDESNDHAGKFCFNYFMTTSYLKIPAGRGEKMDRYCAENYSKSVLVWGSKKVFRKFFKQNEKLFLTQKAKGKSQNYDLKLKARFPIPASPFLFPGRLQEAILGGRLGDQVEQVLKRIQIKKIEGDPRTRKYPNLIVYNDQELRFHPPRD